MSVWWAGYLKLSDSIFAEAHAAEAIDLSPPQPPLGAFAAPQPV